MQSRSNGTWLGPRLLSCEPSNRRLAARNSGIGRRFVQAGATLVLGVFAYPAQALVPLAGVAAISVGSSQICVTNAGGVKCWGANQFGQLGDNSTTSRLIPVDVSGLTSGVISIAAGSTHTCAVTSGGGVKCWGFNSHGQLGDNSNNTRLVPVNVAGLDSGVKAVVAGGEHTCALTTVGTVKCWGSNSSGQLGNQTTYPTSLTPASVTGLSGAVTELSAGTNHTCALIAGGGAQCWGANFSGELGNNAQAGSYFTPQNVSSGVAAIRRATEIPARRC